MKRLHPHEYPRPDFRRDGFFLLDGKFQFAFDDENIGVSQAWHQKKELEQTINVPFSYQSKRSGIGSTEYHPIVWYSKTFVLDTDLFKDTVLLHFGAVDYRSQVWLNGHYVGEHEGGYTPFSFEIQNYLEKDGEQHLSIRVEDFFDCSQPRGKQYWKEYNEMCWYSASSGIWQSVWLENVGEAYLEKLSCTPDIDNHTVQVAYSIADSDKQKKGKIRPEYTLTFTLQFINLIRDPSSFSMDPNYQPNDSKGSRKVQTTVQIMEREGVVTLSVPVLDKIKNTHWWSIETPNLIQVTVGLEKECNTSDVVTTYFGMRKIEIKGKEILLNHQPITQKLVLDQGYWPDSLLTPPDDAAFRTDIERAKQFGFNGARKHQKIEDPHFYYWADVLGFLVWGELPSAYEFSDNSMNALNRDMREFIQRDYNHPSIVAWVPLNESWGVRDIVTSTRQQAFAASLYMTIHSVDSSRIVVTNDGWEQINETDFYGIHDYTPIQEMLNPAYFISQEALLSTSAQKKQCLVDGIQPEEKPLLITEYGGIAFDDDSGASWGYFGKVKDKESFLERLKNITDAFMALPYVQGICYTQLTDVFQEKNGLMDMERNPKVDPARVFQILWGKPIEDIKSSQIGQNIT